MTMVAITATTWTVFWLFLPVTLLASAIFRYNLLSCVYLILVLILPFCPKLSKQKIRICGAYTLTVMIVAVIFLLAHIAFQIALAAKSPYGSLVGESCSRSESIARYTGFNRLDHTNVGNIFRLLAPDVAVFLVSLVTYVLIRKTTAALNVASPDGNQQSETQSTPSSVKIKNALIMCITMLFLALAGIAYPSVVSSVYLLVFISFAMVWTVHAPILVPAVAALRASVSVLTILQLIMLYLYQMQFMQQLMPPDELSSRLLGLTAIVRTDCNETNKLLLQPSVPWTQFVSPGCIFLLHWMLAIGVRMFYEDIQVLQRFSEPQETVTSIGIFGRRGKLGERKPLVEGEEIPHSYQAIESSSTTTHEAQNANAGEAAENPKRSLTKEEILLKISLWLSEVKHYSFYVVALIIMMLWSVTYHSWLTFVLLIWSCVLWLMKNRSKYTLYCSPAFSMYGILLVLLQYIYSLDLKESELPTQLNSSSGNTLYLEDFALRRFTYPCLHLGAQILYLCGFWLVFHQFIYFKHEGPKPQQEERPERNDKSWTEKAALYINELLCKYWIFVVVGFHLAVSTEGYPSGIKIIYMLLFLLNMVTYSVAWTLWRKTLTLYWTVLVIYSMVVLVLIYTYQFHSFPQYWKSFTHFDDQQMADLGLEQSQTSGDLLKRILIPALFLLAVLVQLQYFNKRFLEITGEPTRTVVGESAGDTVVESNDAYEMNELVRGTSAVAEEDENSNWFSRTFRKYWPYVVQCWNGLVSFIMRALEFHVWRLVFITVFTAAIYQVSGLYALYVIIWVSLLPFRKSHVSLFVLTSFITSTILLTIMFYQLHFIPADVNLAYNCTTYFYDENITSEYHLAEWLGVEKMNTGSVFFYHAEGYIGILLLIALERTVFRRQRWRRLWRSEPPAAVTAFYPSVTYKEVDNGLLECAKFLINYFFFKFGVEACFVMAVVTVWVRTDIFSIFYCALLVIALTLRTRKAQHRFWKFYAAILMFLLVWQYLSILGMPPSWCEHNQYPWTIIGPDKRIRNALVIWFHLPDYIVPVETFPSIADFFQLLFVVSQLFVFQRESSLTKYIGDNHTLTGEELDVVTVQNNPKKNFMLKESRSLLDQCKHFLFKYTIWVTMAIIFLAGTSRISVFTLGYLIGFFYLLAKQQDLLMGQPSFLLKVFTTLIGYTVGVITLKAALQIASCVYIDTLTEKACFVVQLMSLVCAKPTLYDLTDQSSDKCELAYSNAGFTWDFICFLFLIIQKRIFASYYFLHVAQDLKISMQLASRGAELFREKFIAEVKERKKIQDETIEAIKKSMRKIREGYSTLHRRLAQASNHIDATRSGDYFMFDDVESRKNLAKEPDDAIMDPLDMIHTADTSGIDKALKDREKDKKKLEGAESESVDREEDASMLDGDENDIKEEKDEEDEPSKAGDDGDAGQAAPADQTEDAVVPSGQKEGRSDIVENEEDQEEADEAVEEDKKSILEKLKSGVVFVWELFLSSIDSLTLFLNKQVKDYRNVSLRLSAEKDFISEHNFKQQMASTANDLDAVAITIEGEESLRSLSTRKTGSDLKYTELKAIEFDKDQHRALRLFYAVWYVLISRTDAICYFLIILNLMLEASMLALVLPITVFLWATLSMPRPSKTFWNLAIIYLEVVIVVKFIFQFEFFPWNSQASTNINTNDPFWWPRFLGIEQTPNWSVMDLLQLLAVFFHISILKVNGLWDATEDDDETEPEQVNSRCTEDAPSTSQALVEGESEEKKQLLKEKFIECAKKPYHFYCELLKQRFSSVTDVYLYMFLCDVINFLIIIFGYNAFGQYATTQSDVVSDIQSNNVPTAFLIMLLIQFVMMLIDRAIYLMKNLFARVVFHIALVIGIHLWMFFILPSINERPFYQNHVAQTYYFFKALYFVLSAYQIRVGYPKRVAGNFLTKSFGTVNLFLFKGYRAIPFLAEITAIMDWMYTGTSMGIGEWMTVWAIHAEVFELKCWRVFETAYPTPRGQSKQLWLKYSVGGLLLFIMLGIIWFPLLLMNVALTIGGVPNNPVQVDIKITIGSFEPIFQVVADMDNIKPWTDQQFRDFTHQYADNQQAALFLERFSSKQVVTVNIDGQSKTVWIISPPQRELLIERLSSNNTKDVRVLFEWTLENDPSITSIVSSSGANQVSLEPFDPARQMLYQLLNGSENVANVTIPQLFPQYIYSSGSSAKAEPASILYDSPDLSYKDVDFTITSLENDTVTSWWKVYEQGYTAANPQISMVVLSDKIAASSLSFLVSYGIIGLYLSVVLVVGRFIRVIFIGTTASIMFNQLPYVDRILNLCNDIFLVREEAEFELEEDLFAKLIFLYRSPKTLIQWTRKPKED